MQKEGGKAPPFGGGKTAFSIEQAQEPKTTLSRSTLNSRSILNSLFLSLSLSLVPQNRTYGSPAASSKIAAFDLVS